MLTYAYELGAAVALEGLTKESMPQWLTGLFGSGMSKAMGS